MEKSLQFFHSFLSPLFTFFLFSTPFSAFLLTLLRTRTHARTHTHTHKRTRVNGPGVPRVGGRSVNFLFKLRNPCCGFVGVLPSGPESEQESSVGLSVCVTCASCDRSNKCRRNVSSSVVFCLLLLAAPFFLPVDSTLVHTHKHTHTRVVACMVGAFPAFGLSLVMK
uniref:Uncharacterized protein n=1 Tax=Anopheles darlingi TaxID=43151 RepID=A0A2M4D1H7_ANODA